MIVNIENKIQKKLKKPEKIDTDEAIIPLDKVILKKQATE